MKISQAIFISLLLFCFVCFPSILFSQIDSSGLAQPNYNFIDLFWSEKEVSFSKHLLSGDSYLYRKATEENFRKFAPQSKVIHLATHAIINDEFPLYSKFLFSNPPTSLDDGLLHTHEIYNLNLNSDLAVLSACNTGRGKLIRGEGIMSLARGFHYAGCANVVLSLWQVDDKSTTEIMKYFYLHLNQGASISEALRNAKIKYLQNVDEVKSHPYYWAGFVHIGADDSIVFNKRKPIYVWLLGLVVFVVALVFVFSKFRKHTLVISSQNITKWFFVVMLFLSFSAILFTNFFCGKENATTPESKTASRSTSQTNNIALADKLAREAYFDSSNFYFEKAAQHYLKNEQWEKYIFCLNGLAKNQIEKTEYDSAKKLLASAMELGSEKLADTHREIAKSYNHLATVFRKLGLPHKALQSYQNALSLLSRSKQEFDSLAADIYKNIGITHYYLGDFARTLIYNDSSCAIRKARWEKNHFEIAQNHSVEGLVYSAKGEPENAFSCYEKALSIRSNSLRKNHPDIAKSLLNMGVIYYRKGDFDNAIKYYQQSLKIKLENIGENNISIAGSYMNLGVVSDNTGDYENAKNYYLKALSIMNRIGASNHILTGDIFMNLGISHKNLKDKDLALEYYQKSLSVYANTVSENHPKVANLYLNLGILHSTNKNHVLAVKNFNKSLTLGHKIFDNNSPHFAITHLNMGIEFLRIKNYFQAEAHFQKALTVAEKVFGFKHAIISEAYQGMGQSRSQQQEYDSALLYYQKAIIALSLDFEDQNIYANPVTNNVSEKIRLMNALFSKAKTFESRYEFQTQDTTDLSFSIKTYQRTIELINKISSGYFSEKSKLFFSDTTYAIFDPAVNAPYKLSRNTKT